MHKNHKILLISIILFSLCFNSSACTRTESLNYRLSTFKNILQDQSVLENFNNGILDEVAIFIDEKSGLLFVDEIVAIHQRVGDHRPSGQFLRVQRFVRLAVASVNQLLRSAQILPVDGAELADG